MKRILAFCLTLLIVLSLSACGSGSEASAAASANNEYASQEEFLEDMAKGISERLSYVDDDAELTDDERAQSFQKLVGYELDQIEKYADLTFEDATFNELAHYYIEACQMQRFAALNYRNATIYTIWTSAAATRKAIISELYSHYNLPLTSEQAAEYSLSSSYSVTYSTSSGTSATGTSGTATEIPAEDTFTVNKLIYSDDHVDLTCKEIRKDGIVFECTNKTPREVNFMFWIALDGIEQSTYTLANEGNVSSGETMEIICHASSDGLTNVEHKTITVFGEGFVNGTEYLTFDAVDVDLGGKSNPDTLPSGQSVYQSGALDIDIVGTSEDGMTFKVKNKADEEIDFHIDDVLLNGSVDGGAQAFTVPAHSEMLCSYDPRWHSTGLNGDDIKTFAATLNATHNSYVKLCSVSYDNGNVSYTKINDLPA